MKAVWTVWLLGIAICADKEYRREKVIVHVFDFAPVPPGAMRMALSAASDIFDFAGIDSEWDVCIASKHQPVPSAAQAGGVPVQIKILPTGMATKLVSRMAFGCAQKPKDENPGFLAYVLYHRIETAAHSSDWDAGILLGIVMAHEVGHLLGLEDSDGIMHPSFSREDVKRASLGHLRFSAGDANRLRTLVVAHNDKAARWSSPQGDLVAR